MSSQSSILGARSFGKSRSAFRCVDAVCDVGRRLWPSKTAANLSSRTGVSKRAVEMWLEGRTEPGADALVNLLRSDAGFELLQSIMDGAANGWWQDFERGVEIAELTARLDRHREDLEKLKGRMK